MIRVAFGWALIEGAGYCAGHSANVDGVQADVLSPVLLIRVPEPVRSSSRVSVADLLMIFHVTLLVYITTHSTLDLCEYGLGASSLVIQLSRTVITYHTTAHVISHS